MNLKEENTNENTLKKWDDRYKKSEYVYGEEPNTYLKEQLDKLKIGRILFAAEGEGRNAVYASKIGWKSSAFDISTEGKKKAEILAKKNSCSIDYRVGELKKLNYFDESFDVVALIYAHFPLEIKYEYHKILGNLLRKGGIIIFEAFSKNNLKYRTNNSAIGGPKDEGLLSSIEEIKKAFNNFQIKELEEKEIELNEGLSHNGKGCVIRFIGIKK